MGKHADFRVCLSAYHNEVTGSRLLLVISFPDGREYRILIDCGYFQEVKYRYLNYVDDLDPTTIDAILVTHNHIDHTGLIPKLVKQGYRKPIYMTEYTQRLIGRFLMNSADQQEDNAKYLRKKYPGDEWKFNALYHYEDVGKTIALCKGVKFQKTIEILPGVKVTFFINGHILGAGMILVQCFYNSRKPINILFTGDYKLRNPFFKVPPLPEWLRKMDLIMVHEATYGATTSEDIKVCFRQNLLEAFKRKQDVLIGGFAQGRFQEVLYDLRQLEDENLIPDYYEIWMDGPLGISTTFEYIDILKEFNPEASDFLPKRIRIVDPQSREKILYSGVPKIIVTTSGMLSNGPARKYVHVFLQRERALIHLIGYAAEETLARTLLDSKRADVVTIGNKIYPKNAVVKTTREKTSHVTLDDGLEFINQFENIEFIGINHGEKSVEESFAGEIVQNCPNVKNVGILDRDNMYCIYQFGRQGDDFSNIVVKKMPAKLQVAPPNESQIKKKQRENSKQKKMVKKEKRRQQKNERKRVSRKKGKSKRK